MSLILK